MLVIEIMVSNIAICAYGNNELRSYDGDREESKAAFTRCD